MTPITSYKSKPLTGTLNIPGDKSISHRAIMFGGLAVGETTVKGLLESEDVYCTMDAMRAFGCEIYKDKGGVWHVHGVGLGGLHEPSKSLDMGNSGTSTRLLMGLAGSHPITCTFTGDASLSKRPMGRVITPLTMMGANITAREGGKLPLTICGAEPTISITYPLPMASAQVKSCVLLAGLNAYGRTTVIETTPTRDHTETMLRGFGITVESESCKGGGTAISIEGHQSLTPCNITVPADPSSAAFATVAALIVPDSEITLLNVGMNPTRNGIYTSLIEMGADIKFTNERVEGGERMADIHVRYSDTLKGIDVPAERVSSMIDEFPVFAVAASFAKTTTTMTGLEELRVKESDRLAMIADGLSACGVSLSAGEDSLKIQGTNKPPLGNAKIATALDHRIAMSFLVMGMVTEQPVAIDDVSPIETSFPEFVTLMNKAGASIKI